MTVKLPRIKAWFMIFRILAVLVWAVMTVLLSSAIVFYETGHIDWLSFFLVMLIASLTQGFPAHIVNEIVDWKSGADQYKRLGEKSGGSKVIKAGLASIPQLWQMFAITTFIIFVLAIILFLRTDHRSLWFFGVGYLVCIFYTLPPLSFAYRPFAGEWLGGFAGIMLNMTGNYFAQTGTVSRTIIIFSVAVGLVYIAIMMLFHYIDYESDRNAVPMKNTTIVFLGLRRSRRYVLALLVLSTLLSLWLSLEINRMFLFLTVSNLYHLFAQWQCDPANVESVVAAGKRLTFETIGFGILFTTWVNPLFLWAAVLVVVIFYLHRKFGKLKTS
jgi:1,4-dihydroxy-2-naphthoate octaprenyltransferase